MPRRGVQHPTDTIAGQSWDYLWRDSGENDGAIALGEPVLPNLCLGVVSSKGPLLSVVTLPPFLLSAMLRHLNEETWGSLRNSRVTPCNGALSRSSWPKGRERSRAGPHGL